MSTAKPQNTATLAPSPPNEASSLSAAAVLGALLCSMLWGGNSVAVKLAAEALPPWCMAGVRFALACTATGTWAIISKESLRLSAAQRNMILVNGVLLYAQIGLFTVGTVWSTSVHSVVLINVYPLFAALGAHFFLRAIAVTTEKVAGLVVAFVGVVALFGDQLALPDRDQLMGDAVVLVSAAILAAKILYVKTLMGRIGVIQLVFWEAVVSVPLFAATSLCLEGPASYGFSRNAFLAVMYQGWAVSALAFMLWTYLLKHHSPHDLSAYSFTTPVFGAVAGYLLLGEPVTVFLMAGAALIILGLYQMNRA